MQPLYAVINCGYEVSGDVDLRVRALLFVSVPVISSGDLAIQGNVDTTSANFTRLLYGLYAPGSGDLRFPTQAGSRMVMFPANFSTPAYVRLETVMNTGSAQTDTRTFTLLTRPR